MLGDDGKLFVSDAIADAVLNGIWPHADWLTPNAFELGLLASRTIDSLNAARDAAGLGLGDDALLHIHHGRCHVDTAEPVERVLRLCQGAGGFPFDHPLDLGHLRLALGRGLARGVEGIGGVGLAHGEDGRHHRGDEETGRARSDLAQGGALQ